MNDKILGYVLLAFGLGLIILSTLSAFMVFTGKSNPAKVFNVEAPKISLPQAGNITVPEDMDLPAGVSLQTNTSKPSEFAVLPDEVFNRLLNSGLYFLAMTFVASSGAKIASVGVQLIKEIKVNVREEKPSNPTQPV